MGRWREAERTVAAAMLEADRIQREAETSGGSAQTEAFVEAMVR